MSDAPFSQSYVLRVTHDNVLKAINRSIQKTTARLGDEDLTAQKKHDILSTLASLNRLHHLWQSIPSNNPELYDEDLS